MAREIDKSFARTDEKEHNNLMALSANGKIRGFVFVSAALDPASILDGDKAASDIAVAASNGVKLGDMVVGVSFSLDVVDLVLRADITAADVLTVIFANNTGATVDLAAGTIRAVIALIDKT